MALKRICIYPKDIQCITGKSDRYGRKLLRDIRQKLGKKSHQYVTIKEFCDYTGLKEDDIFKFIQD